MFPSGCGDMTQSPLLVQKENKPLHYFACLPYFLILANFFSRVSSLLSSLSNILGCFVPLEPRCTLYIVKKSRSHQSHSRLAVRSPVIIVSLSQRKMIFYHKHSHDDSALVPARGRVVPLPRSFSSTRASLKKHLLPGSFLY